MFEWDDAKRTWTLGERGLDFVDAILVFDGRPVVHIPAKFEDETRFLSVAEIEGKFYTVVWTWRGGVRRIISFRRSRSREEEQYHTLFR
jgi:uncharacterized protein